MLFNFIKMKIRERYDKCFNEHSVNNKCYGFMGCDPNFDFLNEACVSCPHLTMFNDNEDDVIEVPDLVLRFNDQEKDKKVYIGPDKEFKEE